MLFSAQLIPLHSPLLISANFFAAASFSAVLPVTLSCMSAAGLRCSKEMPQNACLGRGTHWMVLQCKLSVSPLDLGFAGPLGHREKIVVVFGSNAGAKQQSQEK